MLRDSRLHALPSIEPTAAVDERHMDRAIALQAAGEAARARARS